MRSFLRLLDELADARATSSRFASLIRYFSEVSGPDAECAARLLIGQRGGQRGDERLVAERTLRTWIEEDCSIPAWLFEQSAGVAGDVAETAALLIARPVASSGLGAEGMPSLASWIEREARPALVDGTRESILGLLRASPTPVAALLARWAMGKPLAPVGAQQVEEARAVAAWNALEHSSGFPRLCHAQTRPAEPTEPASLATPNSPASGDATQIHLESSGGDLVWWVIRAGQSWFWDPRTGARALPGRDWRSRVERLERRGVSECVIEGELGVGAGASAFVAHDLIRLEDEDLRLLPYADRRRRLLAALGDVIALAREAREPAGRGARGIFVRGASAAHGEVWAWKPEPRRLRGVLLYAEPRDRGRGRLHTELTFGLRSGDELVPAGRVSIEPAHADALALDRWIRENTRERFGPVRSVNAKLVLEIEHDGWVSAPRARLGRALVRPRWVAWLREASPDEVAALETLVEESRMDDSPTRAPAASKAAATTQIAFEF